MIQNTDVDPHDQPSLRKLARLAALPDDFSAADPAQAMSQLMSLAASLPARDPHPAPSEPTPLREDAIRTPSSREALLRAAAKTSPDGSFVAPAVPVGRSSQSEGR